MKAVAKVIDSSQPRYLNMLKALIIKISPKDVFEFMEEISEDNLFLINTLNDEEDMMKLAHKKFKEQEAEV